MDYIFLHKGTLCNSSANENNFAKAKTFDLLVKNWDLIRSFD